jgi:hypothetical protein
VFSINRAVGYVVVMMARSMIVVMRVSVRAMTMLVMMTILVMRIILVMIMMVMVVILMMQALTGARAARILTEDKGLDRHGHGPRWQANAPEIDEVEVP